MQRTTTPGLFGSPRMLMLAVLAPLGLLAGCAADNGRADLEPPGPASPSSSAEGSEETSVPMMPYQTRRFVVPMMVPRPVWLPAEPLTDDPRLLTWAGGGVDVDRAVRFLVPVGIYDPAGDGRLEPVPRDFLTYLESLERYGANVTAPVQVKVGGRDGVVVSASTTRGLSGSLGCQARGLVPDDCYGLQEFALLHIAMLKVDGRLLLAWARTIPGAEEAEADFAAFEALLADVEFQ